MSQIFKSVLEFSEKLISFNKNLMKMNYRILNLKNWFDDKEILVNNHVLESKSWDVIIESLIACIEKTLIIISSHILKINKNLKNIWLT